MSNLQGVWVRNGVEMNIMKDRIVTSVIDPHDESRRILKHDYLLDTNRIQLYSPTVRDIKHAFKGEVRVIMITPHTMQLESEGGITEWNRK